MKKDILFTVPSYFRDDMNIMGYRFGKGEKSCVVLGALRGDEVQQLYVCARLVSFLREVERDGGIMPGKSVMVVPTAVGLSMNAGSRLWAPENTDINRCFPGDLNGSTTEQIAGALFEKLKAYRYGVYGTIDFYKRFTKDLLNWTPVAAGANLTNYLNANIGNLENTGVEFEINAVAIETRDWNWKIGANVAWNKTVVTKLTTDDERSDYYGVETGGISGGTGNTIQVHQTGKAPYSFFVYQQVYDTEGNPIEGLYVDRNNDGKIDTNDKYCYHKAAPDVTIGLNTTLSYKNWTLALSAHSSIGNWVYDNIHSNGELLSDLWTNSFVNNRTSGALKTNFRTNAQYISDYYVKNASFFKFDNITLSRYFALRPNSDRPMGLNVFATVQNVACISAYDGIDPEIYSGIDNNMYPRPRTYILGIKFNF